MSTSAQSLASYLERINEMRRWMGQLEWVIEHDSFLIRERLIKALSADNLTCFGMLQGTELVDKQYFLERALAELDRLEMADRIKIHNQRASQLIKNQSELQETLTRVQCARNELQESMQRLKGIVDKNWGDF